MALPDNAKKQVNQTGYNSEKTGAFHENYQELYRETLDINRKYQEELARFAEAAATIQDDTELAESVRGIFNSNFDFYVDNNVIVEGGFSK